MGIDMVTLGGSFLVVKEMVMDNWNEIWNFFDSLGILQIQSTFFPCCCEHSFNPLNFQQPNLGC
jgi:hypothetical protein